MQTQIVHGWDPLAGYRTNHDDWFGGGYCDPWNYSYCSVTHSWNHVSCPLDSLGYCGDTFQHDPSPYCQMFIAGNVPEVNAIFTARCCSLPTKRVCNPVMNYGYCMWPSPSPTPTIPGPTSPPGPTYTPVPIDNVPDSTSEITNTSTCSSGFPNWSGKLATNSGSNANILSTSQTNPANNPLTVITYHNDADGNTDLDRMGFWISPEPALGWNTRAEGGAYIRVKKNGPGSYQYLYYTAPETFTSSLADIIPNRAICTDKNNGAQSICTIDPTNGNVVEGNSNFTSWVMLMANQDVSGTQVKLTWKVGFLDNGTNIFDQDPLTVYTVAADKKGAYSWDQSNPTLWRVDLTDPAINLGITNASTSGFTVNFTISDEVNSIISGTTTGTANGVTANSTISSDGQSHTFTLDNQTTPKSDFFSQITSTTSKNYSISEGSSYSSLRIDWSVKDQACNIHATSVSLNQMSDPWLMTMNGEAFSNSFDFLLGVKAPSKITTNTNIPSLADQPAFLSTYTGLSTITSKSLPMSVNSYTNQSYTDLNYKTRNSNTNSWIEYFNTTVKAKATSQNTFCSTLDNQTLNVNSADLLSSICSGYNNANPFVVSIPELTLESNSSCNSKTIFLVNQLIINPDFTDNSSSACLFVVSDTTTINEGTNKTNGTSNANYDQVQAFIITANINIPNDTQNDGLFLKGGLIVNANITTLTNPAPIISGFGRNLTGEKNALAPAEAFYYDGTKYMYLFGDLLSYSNIQNIRETQFTEGNEN
ncbi:MAG: hypothetical protein WCJ58_00285 [bacterium]